MVVKEAMTILKAKAARMGTKEKRTMAIQATIVMGIQEQEMIVTGIQDLEMIQIMNVTTRR